jgi:hypothetical protein
VLRLIRPRLPLFNPSGSGCRHHRLVAEPPLHPLGSGPDDQRIRAEVTLGEQRVTGESIEDTGVDSAAVNIITDGWPARRRSSQ